MALVGALGDIVFTVSSETVETLSKMQWGGSVRIGTHSRHMYHALTEFTGIDPDTFTFTIHLGTYLGVDVAAELVKIWKAEREGTSLPFVIGEKAYGKYRWLIKNHRITLKTTDAAGNVNGADVTVSLVEYLSK
jgi:hypothetical protein